MIRIHFTVNPFPKKGRHQALETQSRATQVWTLDCSLFPVTVLLFQRLPVSLSSNLFCTNSLCMTIFGSDLTKLFCSLFRNNKATSEA